MHDEVADLRTAHQTTGNIASARDIRNVEGEVLLYSGRGGGGKYQSDGGNNRMTHFKASSPSNPCDAHLASSSLRRIDWSLRVARRRSSPGIMDTGCVPLVCQIGDSRVKLANTRCSSDALLEPENRYLTIREGSSLQYALEWS
jgi:hypothetical protein